MRTRGTHSNHFGSMEVSQTYRLVQEIHVDLWPPPASATIVGTNLRRRVQDWSFKIPLDGICCTAAADIIETWGWPSDVALSIGRAIAIKARRDWRDSLSERQALCRYPYLKPAASVNP
jgi:hypothetical protein